MYSLALKSLIAGLLCNLAAAAVLALPDDREQPISIKADKAVRDEKQGFTIYSGNVIMEQGSLLWMGLFGRVIFCLVEKQWW